MIRILIVEDDQPLNNGIILSLKQENYDFTQSFSVREAKTHLAETEFDLIILDINLPDVVVMSFANKLDSIHLHQLFF